MGSVIVSVPLWRDTTTTATRTTSQTSTTSGGTDESGGATSRDVEIATGSGLFVVQFGRVDLAISQSNSILQRAVPGATVIGAQIPFRAMFRGYVAGIAVVATAAKNAGTASFSVFRDGVATGASMTWSNNDSQHEAFDANLYGFTSGQELDVRVTTDGSFAPTTTDVLIDLFLVAGVEAANT